MVLRQVEEGADAEPGSGNTAKQQRVAGDFHRYTVDSRISHGGKETLEVRGFWGGEGTWNAGAIDTGSRGTDHADGMSGGSKSGLDEVGSGGFSRGASDANDWNGI